jgi:hypothetical protein
MLLGCHACRQQQQTLAQLLQQAQGLEQHQATQMQGQTKRQLQHHLQARQLQRLSTQLPQLVMQLLQHPRQLQGARIMRLLVLVRVLILSMQLLRYLQCSCALLQQDHPQQDAQHMHQQPQQGRNSCRRPVLLLLQPMR